jgi:hypothetical protein
MDNVNQSPGQDPQEHSPTQPFRFTPGWPGGNAGYGQPPAGQPGQRQPGQGNPGPAQPGGHGGPGGPYVQPQQPGSPYAPQDSPYTQPGSPYAPQGGPYAQADGPYAQPGPYATAGGAPPPKGTKPPSKRLRWTAGISAAVLLGAGGTIAGLQLAGNGSSPAMANAAQATALNNELSSNGSASSCQPASGSSGSSGSSSSSQTGKTRCHPRHLHLLRLVRGMYGQVAFHTSSGTETLAFERGVIESVGGGHVVVRARNGTTWTWSLTSDSVVRKDGKSSTSALAKGELVFVGGQATGTTKDIRLILIRPAAGSQGSSSSSSAQASGTSSSSSD